MMRCLMNKQSVHFPLKFKLQGACLVPDQGNNHVQASRLVGIGESVLQRWVSGGRDRLVQPQGALLAPEQQHGPVVLRGRT